MVAITHRLIPGSIPLVALDTGGSGLPVVLLHGAMGRGSVWVRLLEALAPRHRAIALDQRGHGRSGKPDRGYGREDYVGDLERAVDALGLERFALVGHSTGGLNAWVYAARHPERVAALVIEDMHAEGRGAPEVESWRMWLAGWPVPFPTLQHVRRYFAALRTSLADEFADLFEERDGGLRPLFTTDAILETIAANEERSWWGELAAVACPALVLKGEDSDYLSGDEAERMARTLRHGRLVVVPGASHTVHADRPEAFEDAVSGFLADVTGVERAPWNDTRLAGLAREQYTTARADIAFDPERSALILVDMQEEFVAERGGPFRVPDAARRVPAMAALLAAFRERGLPVIHTAFTGTHAGLDRPRFGTRMPNRAADAGFDGAGLFTEARFVPELAPRAGEVVIEKPSYGAFYDTPLETILKRLDADTVVLAGTLTDCCVGTTARQAYERGFAAFVVSDATATALPEFHAAELGILRRAFARVVTTEEVLGGLHEKAAPVFSNA